MENIDLATVEGFGKEWRHYDQSELSATEANQLFEAYFGMFEFGESHEGFDLGCGSGRWARLVAPKVHALHCIDPSEAIDVARENLAEFQNVSFHRASAGEIPLADNSQDFGYSLGVLHHIPDPREALSNAVSKLKPGAQMLVYLYYALENRSRAYRAIWRISDLARQTISRLPFPARRVITSAVAVGVYWPLARFAGLVEKFGGDPSNLPLSFYRLRSLYTLRTDALDRFGTRLEHRFTRQALEEMMRTCGLTNIRFSDREPYWIAIGRKA